MKTTLLLLLAVAWNAFGQGRIVWSEANNGPISNLGGSPTSMGSLQLGTNSIFGVTEAMQTGGNGDYFTFSIPANCGLSAIFLTIDNQRTWSWIGTPNFNTQMGFIPNAMNGNLLIQWGLGSAQNGDYGMYMANHDIQSFPTFANYQLDFVVGVVPEPSTWALLALGGAALCGARRWRRK